jgi:hypothetical protein
MVKHAKNIEVCTQTSSREDAEGSVDKAQSRA